MILVLQLLVKESFKIRVSLELRYGTCYAPEVKAETTLPKQERERLIFLAYYKATPLTPLLRIF